MLILYNPPSNAQRKPVLPMSLLSVGAVIEGAHDYIIIDGNLEDDPVAAIDHAIREHGADKLGITVMPGPQLNHAVPQCREIKEMHPDLTIIWGGYFPTQHYDVVLNSEFVDFVVRGHGEVVFGSLMDQLAAGESPYSIPGLAYRHPESGEITSNDLPSIPQPDSMPGFPYHRIPMERYIRPTFMGKRTLPHHSSYGCPFFCNFCAVVNMVGGRWLPQSAERTAAVTRGLVENYGLDAVEFYDNNFFVHQKRTAEFAERIMDLNISWWGEGRIDTMLKYRDSTWELMRDSGLKMVFLGAESGSDETLKLMNKGGTASTENTLTIARKMAEYNIVPEFSFVLGNPPDPERDTHGTMEFIRKLKQVNPRSEIILYMYTPVPLAGELYDQARASGFNFPETLDGWISEEWQEFSMRRSSHMPWLEDPLRKEIHNFERVLNAYYPTSTDPKLTGLWRWVLRSASAWRYHLRVYNHPLELRALQKFLSYQRPETSGF